MAGTTMNRRSAVSQIALLPRQFEGMEAQRRCIKQKGIAQGKMYHGSPLDTHQRWPGQVSEQPA